MVLVCFCGAFSEARTLAVEEERVPELKKKMESLKRINSEISPEDREKLERALKGIRSRTSTGKSARPKKAAPAEPGMEESSGTESRTTPSRPPEKVYNLQGKELDLVETPQSLASRNIDPREEVTLIVRLRHISTAYASKTLQTLLSRGESSREPGLHIVTVDWSPQLILTGEAALIDYALRILHALDVPPPERPEPEPEEPAEPERIVRIINVEHVEAMELSKLITEFLKRTEKRVESSTPTRRTVSSRTRISSTRPRTQYYDVLETTILVDARTQKLIVKTYSEEDLQDILMLVKELDVPLQ